MKYPIVRHTFQQLYPQTKSYARHQLGRQARGGHMVKFSQKCYSLGFKIYPILYNQGSNTNL